MIAIAFLLAVLSWHPKVAVKVRLSPAGIAFAGRMICVDVDVSRDLLNRQLATTIDCENYFRAWQEGLDGWNAIFSRRSCIDAMPAGYCVVGVDLFRLDPKAKSGVAHFSAREHTCFIGGDIQCE